MKNLKSIISIFIASCSLITNFTYYSYAESLEVSEEVDNLSEEYISDHFLISYSKKDEKMLSEIINSIEENYSNVTSHLKCELDDKVKIKLYSDPEEFHKAINWPDAPDWVNGRAKDGVIEILVREYDTKRAITLITHELTHIVTKKMNSGFIPAVIWEGIATYEANQSYLKDNLRSVNFLLSLEELFSSSIHKDLYPIAYSFIEFLIQNKGYEKVIELIKVNYEKNEFDFKSIKEDYNKWSCLLKQTVN